MKQVISKCLFISICVTLVFFLASCTSDVIIKQDIIILFTGDVHCKDDEFIGYAGLKAYKNSQEALSDYVYLVDTGDFIQGDFVGSDTKGDYIVSLMNEVGYDYVVPGNHEFDYGLDVFSNICDNLDAKVLASNITYTGSHDSFVSKTLPYDIVDCEGTKVCFLGISNPDAITSSTPQIFFEDDSLVYNFGQTLSCDDFYKSIQRNVDDARNNGADYVIILSHMGYSDDYILSSTKLINNISGVDAVLDGHEHDVVTSNIVKDAKGNDVYLSSTGTALNNIGRLVITPSGLINISLISSYSDKDEKVSKLVDDYYVGMDEFLNQVICHTDFELNTHISSYRVIRSMETNLGDLVADSIRYASNADIAVANGGGIRTNILPGDILNKNIRTMFPFQDKLSMVKVTGQVILDMLEHSYKSICKIDDFSNIKESSSFLHLSGLRCVVDTSIPSSVECDELGNFIEVSGSRRVKNVEVLENGVYVPLDVNKYYTLASYDYIVINCGSGFSMFNDATVLLKDGINDYEILANYLASFSGNVPEKYRNVDNRIDIR